MNELDQSFLYSYVLKEILLEMKHDDKFKEDLVQFCRVQYSGNVKKLKIIDEFEQNYDKTITCLVVYSRILYLTK